MLFYQVKIFIFVCVCRSVALELETEVVELRKKLQQAVDQKLKAERGKQDAQKQVNKYSTHLSDAASANQLRCLFNAVWSFAQVRRLSFERFEIVSVLTETNFTTSGSSPFLSNALQSLPPLVFFCSSLSCAASTPPPTFLMISGIYPVLQPGLSCPREGGVFAGPKPGKVILSVNSWE